MGVCQVSLDRLVHWMDQREWERAWEACVSLLATGPLSTAERARVLACGSRICLHLHDYGAAARLAEQAQAMARRASDRRTELEAQCYLGVAHLGLGNTRDATGCLEGFLAGAAGHDLGDAVGLAWDHLALARHMVGDLEGALAALEQAADAWRRRGDVGREALALARAAWCHLLQGDPEAALPYLERAEDRCLAAGDPQVEGHLACAWALYHRHRGDLEASDHLCRAVLARGADPEVTAAACWVAAENALDRDDLERACRLSDLALEVAKRWPFPVAVVDRAYQVLRRTRELLAAGPVP